MFVFPNFFVDKTRQTGVVFLYDFYVGYQERALYDTLSR